MSSNQPAAPTSSAEARQARRRAWRRRLLIGGVAVAVVAAVVLGYYTQRSLRYRANVRANRDLGYAALAAGQYDEALRLVQPYARSYVDDMDALWAASRAREAVELPGLAHLGTAAAGYTRLLERTPNSPNAEEAELRLLGLLIELQQWRQAVERTDRVSATTPADEGDTLALARLLARGVSLAAVDRDAEAIDYLDAYLAARPADADAAAVRAALQAKVGNAPATRADEAGDDVPGLVIAATRLLLAGERESAATAAARAAELADAEFLADEDDALGVLAGRDRLLRRLTTLLDRTGQPAVATDLAGRAADALDSEQWQRAHAGRLLFADEPTAVVEATADVDFASGDGEVLGVRALALLDLDRRDEAAAIGQALAERPEGSRGRTWANALAVWRPTLAALFDAPTPDLPTAADRYTTAREAIEAYPHAAFGLILGEALLDLGEPEAAEARLLATAAGTQPTWPRAAFAAGVAASDLQLAADAIDRLRAAQAQASNNRPAYAAAATWTLHRRGARAAAAEQEEAAAALRDDELSDPFDCFRLALVSGQPDLLDASRLPGELILPAMDAFSDDETTSAALARRADDLAGPLAELASARQKAADGDTSALQRLADAGPGDVADRAWDDLRRLAPEAAATSLRASLDAADDGWPLAARASRVPLDASDPADWQRLRAAAERQAEQLNAAAVRTRTRLAALDLSPPNREPDAAALREHALQLGSMTRAWPNVASTQLALVAVLDALDLQDEATRRLREAATRDGASLEVQMALASRLAGEGAAQASVQQVLRRAKDAALADRNGVSNLAVERLVTALIANGLGGEAAELVPTPTPERLAGADAATLNQWRRLGLLDSLDLESLAASEDATVLAIAFQTLYERGDWAGAGAMVDAMAALSDAEAVAEAERLRALLDAAGGDVAAALERLRQATASAAAGDALPLWKTRLELLLRAEGPEPAAAVAGEAAGRFDGVERDRFALFARMAASPDAQSQLGLMFDLLAADAETVPLVARVRDLTQSPASPDAADVRGLVAELDVASARQPNLQTLDLIVAQLALRVGDVDNAARRAAELRRQRPADPSVARIAVEALAAADRIDGAIAAARAWRELAAPSEQPAANAAIGRLHLRAGEATRALDAVRPDLDHAAPAARVAAREVAALAQTELGRPGEALRLLEPLVEEGLVGADSPLLWQIATAAAAAGEDPLAEQILARAEREMLDAKTDTWQRLLLLGEAWAVVSEGRGQSEAADPARESARRLLAAARDKLAGDPAATATLWTRLGGRFGQVGADADARDAYERALAVDASMHVAANNLAMLLVKPDSPAIADAERAEGLITAILADPAVRNSASYPAFVDTLAAVEWKRGRRDAAIDRLNGLIALSPDEAEWRIHLAELLIASGRGDDAREQLRRIDDLFNTRQLTPALRRRLDACREVVR